MQLPAERAKAVADASGTVAVSCVRARSVSPANGNIQSASKGIGFFSNKYIYIYIIYIYISIFFLFPVCSYTLCSTCNRQLKSISKNERAIHMSQLELPAIRPAMPVIEEGR